MTAVGQNDQGVASVIISAFAFAVLHKAFFDSSRKLNKHSFSYC